MSRNGKRPSVAARAAPDEPGHDAPTGEPIAASQRDQLIGSALGDYATVVLAVSGGADSVALMHLAAQWSRHAGTASPNFLVATVDHGLRAESASEAAWVAARARELRLEHVTLPWRGPKSSTAVQEAARAARYRLLGELALSRGAPPTAIAVAHHMDDQAETLLMRLARGSGIDGLSAMPPRRPIEPGSPIDLVRPLLDIPKSRLAATLRAAGVPWLDDPSNALDHFERVRLRKASAALAAAGLTASSLALSARRLDRARSALNHLAGELERTAVCYHDGAYASIDVRAFTTTDDEMRLRLLQRAMARIGGRQAPPPMARLEQLLARISMAQGCLSATLAGCQIKASPSGLLIFREPGRRGLPSLSLAPGEHASWDGRFEVGLAADCPGAVTVKGLPPSAWTELRAQGALSPSSDIPRAAAITLPSFWDGQRLLAVPGLDVHYATPQFFHARPLSAFQMAK